MSVAATVPTKTVHVVAWEFEGGGGFDWYPHKEHADKAYVEELKNVEAFKESNWKATQFSVEIPSEWDRDKTTDEIDGWIWNTFDNLPDKDSAFKLS